MEETQRKGGKHVRVPTFFRNIFFGTQNVCGAHVMRMRCCGTKWSVLYSCADAGIDGKVEINTDRLSFRSQTATQKKVKTPKQRFSQRCCIGCLHRQDSTIHWRHESAYPQFAVPDSCKNNAPLHLLVPRTRIQTHGTMYAINIVRRRYDPRLPNSHVTE